VVVVDKQALSSYKKREIYTLTLCSHRSQREEKEKEKGFHTHEMERKGEALITANKRDLSSAQLHRVKNVFHWREVSPNKFLCSRFDFESFELARWSNQPQ
jgi:hypothetical protein